MLIPTILIDNAQVSQLRTKLESNAVVNLIAITNTVKITMIPSAQPVPKHLVVINLDTIQQQNAVATGLWLQRQGQQVFISCVADYAVLIEVMSDIFDFMNRVSSEGEEIRTELIVTESALLLLEKPLSIRHN